MGRWDPPDGRVPTEVVHCRRWRRVWPEGGRRKGRALVTCGPAVCGSRTLRPACLLAGSASVVVSLARCTSFAHPSLRHRRSRRCSQFCSAFRPSRAVLHLAYALFFGCVLLCSSFPFVLLPVPRLVITFRRSYSTRSNLAMAQHAGAAGTVMKHKQVVLAAFPTGMVKESDFRVEETQTELDPVQLGSNDVAVKLLYISLDPYYRELMSEDDVLGFGSYRIGQPMWGGAVGEVVMSANSEFKTGDTVLGLMKFLEYVIVPKGQGLQKVDASQAPPSYYLGVLGMPGFTAWVGLKLIGKPKKGEQVFVTAAAGAVGQIVGQLAKVYGCRAVGSAGSDEKVELLKTEFGFDDAINYRKEKDLSAALNKHFPNGIDVYFDNVGGETLDAVFKKVNMNSRIALCGAISQYNLTEEERYGLKNLFYAVAKCIQMEGFVVSKFAGEHMQEYVKEMSGYLKEGKVKYKEHVTKGIEHFPTAFIGLMTGQNVGKSVIYV